MPDALTLALAFAAAIAGMGWLALGMEVHWRQVRGDAVRGRTGVTVLRALGAAALALSLGLCLAVDHASMASLVWVMAIAVAAVCVAFTLAFRPRLLGVLLVGLR